ncbi:MAG TPA: hypothetical protein VF950_12495 [Planctomycetota bacterium]
MKRAAVLLILGAALPALANEAGEARARATEVHLAAGGALLNLDGLTSVNMAGSNNEYRLIIVVRDLRAKLTAREMLGGDVYQGVKILWCVSDPSATAPAPAAKPFAPVVAAPAPAPRPAPAAAAYTGAPTRNFVPMAPVEMRRTFWAGPVMATPPRRYDYARGSNCHPSRYGFLVARSCGGSGLAGPSAGASSCRSSGATGSLVSR